MTSSNTTTWTIIPVPVDDPVAAGCAGLRILDAGTGELTRVFVRHEHRGAGLGAVLLDAIEEAARGRGLTRIRMDTRSDLVEARRLYIWHGYAEVPAFSSGLYAEHWYEKRLRARADRAVDQE